MSFLKTKAGRVLGCCIPFFFFSTELLIWLHLETEKPEKGNVLQFLLNMGFLQLSDL